MNKELEYRSADITENDKTLEGYFAVYNEITDLGGGYYEMIEPNAFEYRNEEVKAVIDHDYSPLNVIGSLGAGTLELKSDETGLFGKVKLPDTTNGNDLYRSVQRGDINKCSIGFEVLKSSFKEIEGKLVDVIERAVLWEVSAVTFPAYETTTLAARSRREQFEKNEKRKQLIQNLRERGVIKNGENS